MGSHWVLPLQTASADTCFYYSEVKKNREVYISFLFHINCIY